MKTVTQFFRGSRLSAALILILLAAVMTASVACSDDGSGGTDTGNGAIRSVDAASVVLDQSTNGIWVTGAGRVSVTPDLATLRVGVEASDETVSAAMTAATASMQGIINSLLAAGITEDDIQTLTFNISPRYEWNDTLRRSEMVGFTVTNTVRATVRDINALADVIDAAVAAGGENARVDGLSFSVDDTAGAEREARALAMEAAREQAEQLASLAGVTLGDPFYVAESGAAPIAQDMPEMIRSTVALDMDESASIPILAGENDIVIYVRIGYAIS